MAGMHPLTHRVRAALGTRGSPSLTWHLTGAARALGLLLAVTSIATCRPSAALTPVAPTDAPTLTAAVKIQATPTLPFTPTRTSTRHILPATQPALPNPVSISSAAAAPLRSSSGAPSHVLVSAHASKISQLIGDYDKERLKPTNNLTANRYRLESTDLGIPFLHKGRTYLLFGDTLGARGGDAIAYTTDTNPEDGLDLEFIHDASGVYQPIQIPGVDQGEFEVPTEGVSVDGRMYVYHTTDASDDSQLSNTGGYKMGRSVLAVSDDDGHTFRYLYDLSRRYFVNVSVVPVASVEWPGLPVTNGEGLVTFGSGAFRRSHAYLAFQPSSEITTRASLRYWAGLNSSGEPVWSQDEENARALFDQPCVGELSVSYNRFIKKWIMLYNCEESQQRGIHLRTADQPWGPWSPPQTIFDPWTDNGYCHFIHASWQVFKCDNVQAAGQENTWGGEYGAYQFRELATGDAAATTIYFTMSTWNPYTVVLMKAGLQLTAP